MWFPCVKVACVKVFLFFTLIVLSVTSKLEFEAPHSNETPSVISSISVLLNDPLPSTAPFPFEYWKSPNALANPPSPDKSSTGSVTVLSNVSVTVPTSARPLKLAFLGVFNSPPTPLLAWALIANAGIVDGSGLR